jgi:hypothetical protein
MRIDLDNMTIHINVLVTIQSQYFLRTVSSQPMHTKHVKTHVLVLEYTRYYGFLEHIE